MTDATFTQEQFDEAIAKANADKDAEYSGVLEKNAQLLGEKKSAKERALLAETDKQQMAEQQAKTNGDMEALEKTLTAKYSAAEDGYKSQLEQLNGLILGGKKNEAINEIASNFLSADAGKLMLSNMVSTGYGDDNKVITQFKNLNGEVITTDKNEFVKYLQGDKAFTPILKAIDSAGGGSLGNKSTGGASDNSLSSIQSERRKKLGII